MSKIFIDYDDLLDYINSLLGYTANLTREETLKQIKGYMKVMEKFQFDDKLSCGRDINLSNLSLHGDWDNDLHDIEVRWDR